MSRIITTDTTSGLEDVIANNIPSRAFRYTVENKNLLANKGAIYIGTGETRTTKMLLDYPDYETNTSYSVGDCVTYGDENYRCNTNISSPSGSFNSNYWDKITIEYESAVTDKLDPPSDSSKYYLQCENGTLRWVLASQIV